MLFGAIEAGGTKFVCAVGNEKNEILERVSFPTTTPQETMEQVFGFFDRYELDAIGIGSFGPIDVLADSPTYGHILATPKQGWKNFDFLGAVKRRYAVPAGWSTDVNVAALGEAAIGAAQGVANMMYLTIGTGIGAGALVNGELLQGIGHPEMGHLLIHPHPDDDYEGTCPYHGKCLEGMAAGPSVPGRLHKPGNEIRPDHPVYTYIADYIAQALQAYTLILRPEKIVLGGGVMKTPGLLHQIKARFEAYVAGYVEYPDLEDYLVLPGLGDNAGIIGALVLAGQQLQ